MESELCYFEGSYFFIDKVGESYSITIEFPSFKTKLITNDNLRCNAYLIELNEENLNNFLIQFNDFKQINFTDFSINRYIIYKSQIIKIDNWKDVYYLIKNKIIQT